MRNDGTIIEHSRVITWQRTVSQSFRESPSIFSAHTCASRAGATPVAPPAEAAIPKAPTIARSASAPTVAPVPEATTKSDSGSGAATHILGTLLGAAAGAAVTYAFMRSERDSAKKEADFSAFMDAKNAVNTAAGFFAQAPSQPPTPQQDPQPAQPPVETAAPPIPAQPVVHRIEDDARSSYSRASQIPRTSVPRQIEAAPASYYSPSQFEAPRTQIAEPLAIEYAPAYSVAPSRAPSRLTPAHRSNTSPELLMIERARSTVSTAKPESIAMTAKPPRPSSKPQSVVSKAQSVAHSAAPSSFISSFVADRDDEKSSSGRSKARSSHSSSSKHTSHKEHKEHGSSSRKERSSSPSPPAPASKAPSKAPTKVASKAASIVSSILGRDKSKHDDDDDFIDDLDIEELSEDDLDTVVPSDSISQIGDAPRRRHRSHRSHKTKKDDDAETSVSHRSKKHSDDKESSVSHRSKKQDDDNESSISKSSRSHRSHRSRKTSAESADDEDSSRPHRSSRSSKSKPSITSEPSEVSTVRPVKPSKTSRKDSLTQGQYDNLFDEVRYGTGAVHASRHPPTPSMVSAARKNPSRSMIKHTTATKMRNFEGSQAGRARDDSD